MPTPRNSPSKKRRKAPKKLPRPPIQPEVQLKLWIKAGGRCEFFGCNKPLWYDSLTLGETNYSEIAHIVAASPSGPRGDPVRSPALAAEFSNLLLLCRKDHKTVDSKRLEKKYPEDLLLRYKLLHEARIERATATDDSQHTRIITFEAKIDNKKLPSIDPKAAIHAIEPKFSETPEPFPVDLTTLAAEETSAFFSLASEAMAPAIRHAIQAPINGRRANHLSVFALAPIPLLVKLGEIIGDAVSVDLFEYRRLADSWCWLPGPTATTTRLSFFSATSPSASPSKTVILSVSVSGLVEMNRVTEVGLGDLPHYQIVADSPSLDFLQHRSQLIEFGMVARAALRLIQEAHGSDSLVHCFLAIPAPFAIELGRVLLPRVDPTLVVYEYSKANARFFQALLVNER